jgi:hypothetical protein
MIVSTSQAPLFQMVRETPTDYWNDSCAADELGHAIERGATGATIASYHDLIGAVGDLVLPNPDRRPT